MHQHSALVKRVPAFVISLCAIALAPALGASPAPAPSASPSSAPLASATPAVAAPGGGHSYDPCAMVSQQDVASAAGVAVNQVFTPATPTKNECVWAIGNKAGVAGQQVALTVQTVDQVKQAHGIAKFGAILSAVQGIPGVSLPSNPVVTRAFADAQVVVGLGDRAGWKNGTLSVLKNEMLFAVNVTGQQNDDRSLLVAKSVARAALSHMPTQ